MDNILKSGPLIAYWSITNRCNLHCYHCHVTDTSTNYTNDDSWYIIANKLIEANVNMVIISGGEPLLHPNLINIIRMLKSKKTIVFITTNGYLVDSDTLNHFIELGLNQLQVSLDSPFTEQHDRFRNKSGSFNKAINTINLCSKMGMPVGVNTVITAYNLNDLLIMGYMLKHIGVSCWRLTITVPRGRGSNVKKQFYFDDKKLLDTLQRLRDVHPDIILDDPLCVKYWRVNSKYAKQCSAGKIICAIEPNGVVKPCIFLDSTCGNLLESTMSNIWNSIEMTSFRSSSIQIDECIGCSVYAKCLGGCRAFHQHNANLKIAQKYCF